MTGVALQVSIECWFVHHSPPAAIGLVRGEERSADLNEGATFDVRHFRSRRAGQG